MVLGPVLRNSFLQEERWTHPETLALKDPATDVELSRPRTVSYASRSTGKQRVRSAQEFAETPLVRNKRIKPQFYVPRCATPDGCRKLQSVRAVSADHVAEESEMEDLRRAAFNFESDLKYRSSEDKHDLQFTHGAVRRMQAKSQPKRKVVPDIKPKGRAAPKPRTAADEVRDLQALMIGKPKEPLKRAATLSGTDSPSRRSRLPSTLSVRTITPQVPVPPPPAVGVKSVEQRRAERAAVLDLRDTRNAISENRLLFAKTLSSVGEPAFCTACGKTHDSHWTLTCVSHLHRLPSRLRRRTLEGVTTPLFPAASSKGLPRPASVA
mmetsp:Transcript_18701/g.45069  ORF Transcript_18701/g.45069 Transcript_18701/m.45069 type:complete len:324 (+) Transcript_18701:45-1016(+)